MDKICTVAECGNKHQAKGLCKKHYMRQWYLDHPEGLEAARIRMSKVPRAVMRDRQLRYDYGVNSEWYEQTLREQGGVCKICRKPENKSIRGKVLRLAVDHCHDTGKVRGLLCQACNRGIGCFNHDVKLLQAAIDFLNQPPSLPGEPS